MTSRPALKNDKTRFLKEIELQAGEEVTSFQSIEATEDGRIVSQKDKGCVHIIITINRSVV
jgi:hypothetical protein